MWCDGKADCADGSDEHHCSAARESKPVPYPSLVQLADHGSLDFGDVSPPSVRHHSVSDHTATDSTPSCPHTHFQCLESGHCLPVYMRCNGVSDCETKEDESECQHYVCPGYFRCRSSSVCVHPVHVCDGLYHCPQRDDELLCDLSCPRNCTCYGLAFACTGAFSARTVHQLRYLNGEGSGMALQHLEGNVMLISLSLARCGIVLLDHLHFPNLHSLDLSWNDIKAVDIRSFRSLRNLRTLRLTNNPLVSFFRPDNTSGHVLQHLQLLDVSGVGIPTLDVTALDYFVNLLTLNLSHTGIVHVKGQMFRQQHLRVLDVRGCPVTSFPRRFLQDLGDLQAVYADNYKLCCAANLPPGLQTQNCAAPFDEVSSCRSLLRSLAYRLVLFLVALLAITGNIGSLIIRLLTLGNSGSGFQVFILHLCASDLFMGVYLAIIGVADQWYKNNYLWEDNSWRHSVTCQVGGFFSLLSSEVSACTVCLITADRFLVLRFPFSHIHFQQASAQTSCIVVWIVGIVLAGIPLLPATEHWQFYSQKGICIPLPVTRQTFAGQDYVFGVVIVLNFLLFVFIAFGQISIFLSVQVNRLTSWDSAQRAKNVAVARRLFIVAMSDFCCWFPIGSLGLLAANGFPVPGQVNVAMAIFVLPLNSALNPFLYTVGIFMERQQRAREKRLLFLIAQSNSKTATR